MEVNENPGGKVQLFRTDLTEPAHVLTPPQRPPLTSPEKLRSWLEMLKRCERPTPRLNDLFLSDLLEQPGAREIPIIIHRGERNSKHLRCLLVGHASEIP